MKTLLLVFLAFAALAAATPSYNRGAERFLRTIQKSQDCNGTPCPNGCCPEQNWHCCDDGFFCASSEGNCPQPKEKKVVVHLAESKQDCDGTLCPGGCCPYENWYCCPDNLSCAVDSSYCKKENKIEKLIKMAAKVKQDCDGTLCPGGCCPYENWYCCPDNLSCAVDSSYCKKENKVEKLMKMAAPKAKLVKAKQDCDGTLCPGGCCPYENWYCCPDNLSCAVDSSYCKKENQMEKLVKMATKKVLKTKQDCDGTLCPGGCCPYENWYCCPDNLSCAVDSSYCKKENKIEKLMKMAAPKVAKTKQDCEGTLCPGGCCPYENWYCCPDNLSCAVDSSYCKKENKIEKLMKMAAPKAKLVKTKQDCEGTLCPGGCCPYENWYCCPDNLSCAVDSSYCKKENKIEKLMKMAAPKAKLVKTKQDCEGTLCPGGCCPYENWYCCPDNLSCAVDSSYCKKENQMKKLMKMATKKVLKTKQDCDGTLCPGGCCPYENWYCCPDNLSCAVDSSYCKKENKVEKLMKMAAPKAKLVKAKQDCEGTLCPGGCCPYENWYCCPDNLSCAVDSSYCKKENQILKLQKMAAAKSAKKVTKLAKAKQDCDGTLCPGGCCPYENWYCCPDNLSCAVDSSYCKKENKVEKLIKMAPVAKPAFKVLMGCNGTECAGGCCPMENAVCCPGNIYCATEVEMCP